MAIYKITIKNNNYLNPSLQSGDHAFYQQTTTVSSSTDKTVKTADNTIYIGIITRVGQDFVHVDTNIDINQISGFLMFSKDKRINNSSLKGYYAQVTLRNNDSQHASELFALNSEAVESSK